MHTYLQVSVVHYKLQDIKQRHSLILRRNHFDFNFLQKIDFDLSFFLIILFFFLVIRILIIW